MSPRVAARGFPSLRFSAGRFASDARTLPEEVPVAIVHDATTTAVMMTTPADLEDFAIGFTYTEGVAAPGDIRDIEIVERSEGIEVRLWLKPGVGAAMVDRRRTLAGPSGCGLCGLDSLKAAQRPLPRLADSVRLSPEQVQAAVASLARAQPLGRTTRAVHAAGYWSPTDGLVLAREDVGRHNALDKVVGALLRAGAPRDGVIVLTSRISIEMVQKAVLYGVQVVAAVSAPTAAAVEAADAARLTLVGVARDDGFEIFTHPVRVNGGEAASFVA